MPPRKYYPPKTGPAVQPEPRAPAPISEPPVKPIEFKAQGILELAPGRLQVVDLVCRLVGDETEVVSATYGHVQPRHHVQAAFKQRAVTRGILR